MQDMALNTIDTEKFEPMELISRTLDTVRPAGRFVAGGLFARLEDAARRGDIATMQTILIAMGEHFGAMQRAIANHDYSAMLNATTALGFEFFAIPGGIIEIFDATKAGIVLINALAALINIFSNDDDGEGTAIDVVNGRQNRFTVACEVEKENQGCVLGDNIEAILTTNVTFKTRSGPPPSLVLVNLNLAAGGSVQTGLAANLALTPQGGTTRPANPGVLTPGSNAARLVRAYSFVVANVADFTIDLTENGGIAWGANGSNISLQLDVSCRAFYLAGTVIQPQPVNLTAVEIGVAA